MLRQRIILPELSMRLLLHRLKKAEAGLRQAKTNLGYTRIVSPVNGVVIAKKC